MKNFEMNKLGDILSAPISGETVMKLLADEDSRDDFLMNYSYFNSDGNRNVYLKWITKNLSSKSNIIIEHIFKISNYCNVYESLFLDKIEYVLKGKYWQFTKLACLDFLISQHSVIDKNVYVSLNSLGFIHTKNELVKFQSYVNLSICKESEIDSIEKIKIILQKTQYPTLFYRLINQFYFLPKGIRVKFTGLLLTEVEFKQFNDDVIAEIKNRLNQVV